MLASSAFWVYYADVLPSNSRYDYMITDMYCKVNRQAITVGYNLHAFLKVYF